MSAPSGEERAGEEAAQAISDAAQKLVLARVIATTAAFYWGVLFFGIVDLTTITDQRVDFYRFYLLEAGWGLLFTALVMVPLLIWAVRPRNRVLLQQTMMVAVAVILCGVVALAFDQVFAGIFLATSAALPHVLAGWPLYPIRGLSIRGLNLWLGALVALAMLVATVYAWQMVDASLSGVRDTNSRGLWHLPMQAAFGAALASSAAISVLAGAANAPGWRLSTWPVSVSAVWFGAVSVAYPDHIGSLGRSGGWAAIAWGLAFCAVGMASHRSSEVPTR